MTVKWVAALLLGGVCRAQAPSSSDGSWLRPTGPEAPLIWGRTDGLVFGLPSTGGMRGPRGVIRVGVWNPRTSLAERVNFISIDPVTEGVGSRHSRWACSELEPSKLDAPLRGKRLWTLAATGAIASYAARPQPIEQLTVRIEVERFDANGAHAYLMVRMRSDKPRELSLSVHHHPGSAPIEELTLDATMGNYERLRHLWLKNRILDSRDLYRGYSGNGFAQREEYPIEEILKTAGGDAIALLTTDEHDPASVEVRHGNWQYRSVKLTQYWRVPAKHMQPDLRVFVNGRRMYWNSEFEVPGGIAFESFQIRQRYVQGQEFIFGLTPEAPREIRPALPRLGKLPER